LMRGNEGGSCTAAFNRGLKEGARGRWSVTANGLDGGGGGGVDPRPEVGDDPDLRAPPVGERCKKKRRGARDGPAGRQAGPGGPAYACALRKRRPAAWAGLWAEEEKKKKRRGEPAGSQGKKGEGGREKDFLFLKILFKFIFQTFKLQSNKNHAFESGCTITYYF
jgi:hypothetical protein